MQDVEEKSKLILAQRKTKMKKKEEGDPSVCSKKKKKKKLMNTNYIKHLENRGSLSLRGSTKNTLKNVKANTGQSKTCRIKIIL